MKVVCAWCKKPMGKKEPLDDPTSTHGICPDCLAEQERKVELPPEKPQKGEQE